MKDLRKPAAAALALLLLEGALRLTPAPPRPTEDLSYERFLEESAGPYFQTTNVGSEWFYRQIPTVYQALAPQQIQTYKAPDIHRVVVIGDDNADSLAAWMLDRVARFPERHVQVIGMGTSGGDLGLLERRAAEIPKLHPDAVVVFFGKNLFLENPSFHPWLHALSGALRRSRLLALLLGPETPPARLRLYDRHERLAAFGRALDAVARRVKVPVVVLTLPSNLMFPPASDPAELEEPGYARAVMLHDSGRGEEALRVLSELARREPEALWEFTLGLWRLERGERAQARRHLLAARDLDRRRTRVTSGFNGLIRSEARRGFKVLDAERVLEAAAPGGVPGWDYFLGDQRLGDKGAQILADACLDFLARGLTPAVPPVRERESPHEPFVRDLMAVYELYDLKPDTLAAVTLMALSHKLGLSRMEAIADAGNGDDDEAALRLAFARALWSRGARAAAWRLNSEAADPGRWEGEAALQRARFLLSEGRCGEARGAFVAARHVPSAGGRALAFLEALDDEGVCGGAQARASSGRGARRS